MITPQHKPVTGRDIEICIKRALLITTEKLIQASNYASAVAQVHKSLQRKSLPDFLTGDIFKEESNLQLN